jgi:TIR domain
MGAIFISYRRDDTEGQAGRLFEALCDAFGADMVFMDVATIEPGVDFRKVIERNTAECGVLLALIGRDWLSMVDEAGSRRLDNPNDFVRLETASALRREIPVIPVLVQGARMPRAEDLPEDMRDLAFRNSVELTHARWESDVQLLVKALRPHAKPSPPPSPTPPGPHPRPWLWPVVGAAALATGLGVWNLVGADPEPPAPVPRQTEPAQPTQPDREKAEQERLARASAEQERQAERAAQMRAHNEGICVGGYVWRDARPGDKVCVTPAVRSRSAAENDAAAQTRQPGGGPYGPNTCRQGFVWREAFAGDQVCVPPASREAAAADNAAARDRVVPPPA